MYFKKMFNDLWPDLLIWGLTILVFILIFTSTSCNTQKEPNRCNNHVITEDGVNWYSEEPEEIK